MNEYVCASCLMSLVIGQLDRWLASFSGGDPHMSAYDLHRSLLKFHAVSLRKSHPISCPRGVRISCKNLGCHYFIAMQ